MELVISGRKLAFEVEGQGVPFVFLHAFPFDRRFGADLARRLAPRAQVIRPDLRGFGESSLDGDYTLADLADDVCAVLDGLQIQRAVVGGVSMGGYVALAFAARHAQRLMGLVLADTKAGADSPEARQGREEAIATVGADGSAALLEKLLPRLLSPGASPELVTEVRALGRQPVEGVQAALRAMRDRPDRTAELGAITCPTLIVVGTEDVVTPPGEAAVMATAIGKAVLIEIPEAGHLANLEAPEPFFQAVAGFLRRAVVSG